MDNKLFTLDGVLAGLMSRYQERVPDVPAILNRMKTSGIIHSHEDVKNDHIAFRTMGVPQLGIDSLEKIFLHYGYERRDQYNFARKKLNAHWYAPPEPRYPRIFISELRVDELSTGATKIIRSYTDEVLKDPVLDLNLDDATEVDAFLHRPLWRTPTWDDFVALRDESEYAAWVIYNRYYLNHFTISVHALPEGYNTIEEFNHFLESNGFKLNDAGGKAKVSADGLLIQSSTVAAKIDAVFDDGDGGSVINKISGSYVEFAERRPLPSYADKASDQVTREQRREGFEAASADRIFESTYSSQTSRLDT